MCHCFAEAVPDAARRHCFCEAVAHRREDVMMKPIVADANLTAYCGLYCGACGAYRRERCPGCHENKRAGWCKLRACCIEHGYSTCADCQIVADPRDCKKFNNFIARLFGLIFRSDRRACILQIREIGLQEHAERMAASELHSIRR
jgi:hypothetical protein